MRDITISFSSLQLFVGTCAFTTPPSPPPSSVVVVVLVVVAALTTIHTFLLDDRHHHGLELCGRGEKTCTHRVSIQVRSRSSR